MPPDAWTIAADAASIAIFLSWPLWFELPPRVAEAVRTVLDSPEIVAGFWGLHLRVEKDWPYHAPDPEVIMGEVRSHWGLNMLRMEGMGHLYLSTSCTSSSARHIKCKIASLFLCLQLIRCGPPNGTRLFIAGGFMTPEDDARASPYMGLLCNASTSPFDCVDQKKLLSRAQLPAVFASSFDLRALVESEILSSPSCRRLWGARDSTFAIALNMRRWAAGQLPSAMYDLRKPRFGWLSFAHPGERYQPLSGEGPCAESSEALLHSANTILHLF